MITLQVLNKIIQTGDPTLIINNNLDDSYFLLYEKQFNYINKHLQKYGNVPNKETFLSEFPEFSLFEVTESDEYLQEKLFEEHLYNTARPIAIEFAAKLKFDADEAKDFLLEQVPKLTLTKGSNGIDIIKNCRMRFNEYKEKTKDRTKFFITSGFKELDDYTDGGFECKEELVVLFSRTGHGKSWVVVKILGTAWQNKKRVGLISPEMGANKIGYRFDSIYAHLSNTVISKGYETDKYEPYIDELEKQDGFIVATPKDFKRKITVSKLKNFCLVNKLDVLGIDGIGYLKDERFCKGDKRAESLTKISEDLMSLSNELGIPVIVITQSNRDGATELGPQIENIKDSDGISYNASTIIALKQENGVLVVDLKKNRGGKMNKQFRYNWNIDKGEFIYLPEKTVAVSKPQEEKSEDVTSVF